MDYIAQNLSQSLIVAGIALLIIEVAILGFATFVLLPPFGATPLSPAYSPPYFGSPLKTANKAAAQTKKPPQPLLTSLYSNTM
jgi:hypothetical protein